MIIKEMSFTIKIKGGHEAEIEVKPAGHTSILKTKITINSKDYSREKLWRKLEAQMDLFLGELH